MHTDATPLTGLTAAEAQLRLRRDGPNELPAQGKRGLQKIVLEVLREPMFLLLVSAGVLYLVLGKASDAALLLCFVAVVIAITVVQERRTERALDALRELASPRALVIRAGERLKVDARELVVGDCVVIVEGERIPADGLLRAATHLEVDESVLTGESVPVRKAAATFPPVAMARPGGDDLPFLTGYASGWHTHLNILIAQLSGAPTPPFWATHARLKEEYTKLLPPAPAS